MKKISILVFTFLLSVVMLNAQNVQVRPKASQTTLHYQFELDSANYQAIDSTGTPIILDNCEIGNYNLDLTDSFRFTFNKRTYSVFRISASGALGFGSGEQIDDYNAIGTDTRGPLVAPFWDHMQFPNSCASGKPYYQIEINGNDTILIVEWHNITRYFTSSEYVVTFQVRLHSETGIIEFYYLDMDDIVNFTDYTSASIGLNDVEEGQIYSSFISIVPGKSILVDYVEAHDDVNKDSLAYIKSHTVYRFIYQYKVNFTVTDTNGNALANANIKIGDQTLTTDANGRDSIYLISENYTAIISKDGYYNDTLNFNVNYSDTAFTIKLTPVSNLTSITNNTKEFSLYPNPAHGHLVIDPGNTNPYDITISNLNGKILYHKAGHRGKQIINLSDLPQGIYIIQLQQGDEFIYSKFVKD